MEDSAIEQSKVYRILLTMRLSPCVPEVKRFTKSLDISCPRIDTNCDRLLHLRESAALQVLPSFLKVNSLGVIDPEKDEEAYRCGTKKNELTFQQRLTLKISKPLSYLCAFTKSCCRPRRYFEAASSESLIFKVFPGAQDLAARHRYFLKEWTRAVPSMLPQVMDFP